jgi:hypothetical protein
MIFDDPSIELSVVNAICQFVPHHANLSALFFLWRTMITFRAKKISTQTVLAYHWHILYYYIRIYFKMHDAMMMMQAKVILIQIVAAQLHCKR